MNKNLKNEIVTLMGLGALTALLFKQKKMALGLTVAAGTLALASKSARDSFRGKVVLITGGSRGLGLALAKRLVSEGAYVSLLARDAHELEQAKNKLLGLAKSKQVFISQCDITDRVQLTKSFEETIEHWGTIDMLINNAGSILVGPFDAMATEDFEAQMKLHLYANINATKEILPIFRKRGSGRIVNICSMGGKVAVPHMLPYDASKFALAGFSQGLNAELSHENISVTTVYPALMRTGSPIQAVFKGQAEKEFSWFANADVFPGLSMSADKAAAGIIEAARRRQAEYIPALVGKIRMAAGAFFPETLIAILGLVNRLMPRGTSSIYRTGAQSQRKKTYILKSFEQRAEKAQTDLNQEPKTDAEFSLGLH